MAAAKPERLAGRASLDRPSEHKRSTEQLGPAYYAAGRPSRWRDVRALLHPPYTAWHLSYVIMGGVLVTHPNWTTLGATVLAFFLAVGVGAHALDELQGRPLSTSFQSPLLVAMAGVSMAGATAIGIAGIERVGPWLVLFMVVGLLLVLGYNLELFGGRLHSDLVFAVGWGAFPVVVSAFAQSGAVTWEAVLVAVGAAFLSGAQRALSTPARRLRREVRGVAGTVEYNDGSLEAVDARALILPLERALRLMSWGVVAVALGLLVGRVVG